MQPSFTHSSIATGAAAGRKATVRSTALLLAIAWALPFILHMVPWGGAAPLGALLLPMFWAAFIAVYLYGLGIGLLVGLFSPILNLLLTRLPAAKFQLVLSFEIAVFVCLSWFVLRSPRARKFWLLAPLAYIAAKACSTTGQALTGFFGDIGAPATFFTSSISTGLPGLLMLAAINFALAKNLFSGSDGDHGPTQAA